MDAGTTTFSRRILPGAQVRDLSCVLAGQPYQVRRIGDSDRSVAASTERLSVRFAERDRNCRRQYLLPIRRHFLQRRRRLYGKRLPNTPERSGTYRIAGRLIRGLILNRQ